MTLGFAGTACENNEMVCHVRAAQQLGLGAVRAIPRARVSVQARLELGPDRRRAIDVTSAREARSAHTGEGLATSSPTRELGRETRAEVPPRARLRARSGPSASLRHGAKSGSGIDLQHVGTRGRAVTNGTGSLMAVDRSEHR